MLSRAGIALASALGLLILMAAGASAGDISSRQTARFGDDELVSISGSDGVTPPAVIRQGSSLPRPMSLSANDIVQVLPASPVGGNCIPFGNNTSFDFSGMIYRDVPAFDMLPGDYIKFDTSAMNGQDIDRDIYFCTATVNPTGATCGGNVGTQNVDCTAWVQVVSELNPPIADPQGNNVIGDFELTYQAEAPFSFPGGGFLIGFAGSPPATVPDAGCEQVGASGSCGDASGQLYARFCRKPHLETNDLDVAGLCSGTGIAISGFAIESVAPRVGPCDLAPIEAKLDDEFRFTDDDELLAVLNGIAAAEAKLDDEFRFTDDDELQALLDGFALAQVKLDSLELAVAALEVKLDDAPCDLLRLLLPALPGSPQLSSTHLCYVAPQP